MVDGPGADTPREREALFWTTCLPLRLLLAFCAAASEVGGLRSVQVAVAGYYALWGVGLLWNFSAAACVLPRVARAAAEAGDAEAAEAASARVERAQHGNFGGRVWWQWARPVHAALLLAFAASTFAAPRPPLPAFSFLVADVSVAAVAGGTYYSLARVS